MFKVGDFIRMKGKSFYYWHIISPTETIPYMMNGNIKQPAIEVTLEYWESNKNIFELYTPGVIPTLYEREVV